RESAAVPFCRPDADTAIHCEVHLHLVTVLEAHVAGVVSRDAYREAIAPSHDLQQLHRHSTPNCRRHSPSLSSSATRQARKSASSDNRTTRTRARHRTVAPKTHLPSPAESSL